jgi:hypothetical protein
VDRAAWFGGLEHFDDDHMPALTDRALCQGSTGEFLVLVAVVSGGVVARNSSSRPKLITGLPVASGARNASL